MVASHNSFFDEILARKRSADLLGSIGLVVCGRLQSGRIKLFARAHRKFSIVSKSRITYCRLLQIAGPPAKELKSKKVPIVRLKQAIDLLANDVALNL
jgi:hypothetical protein